MDLLADVANCLEVGHLHLLVVLSPGGILRQRANQRGPEVVRQLDGGNVGDALRAGAGPPRLRAQTAQRVHLYGISNLLTERQPLLRQPGADGVILRGKLVLQLQAGCHADVAILLLVGEHIRQRLQVFRL